MPHRPGAVSCRIEGGSGSRPVLRSTHCVIEYRRLRRVSTTARREPASPRFGVYATRLRRHATHTRPAAAVAHRRGQAGGSRFAPADVPLLLPGDDGVQHRQAAHPGPVHRRSRSRQPAVGAAGFRRARRCRDAALHPRRVAPAAAVGHPHDPGRDRTAADRVLGLVQDRRRRHLGRLLPRRADSGPAPHQSILGAGERHLRRPAGEAPLRLHRRRGQPGRHDRLGGGDLLRRCGGCDQPAAGEQRTARRLRRGRHGRHASGPQPVARRRRRERREDGRPRQQRVSDVARVAPPATHRADHRLCGRRRRSARPATEHGGGGVGGRGRHRPHRRLPRPGAVLPVARRIRHPGLADEPHTPPPRHRVRPVDPAHRPRIHRRPHPRHRSVLGGRRGGASSTRRCATRSTRRRARDPVPAAAGRHQAPGQVTHRRHCGPLRQRASARR